MLSVLLAVAIPQTMSTIDRSRGLAAARYLAARMALARAQAVGRATTVALRFQEERSGITISTIQDGNRNGVRTRDIDLQIDRATEGAVMLSDLFPGVDIGLTPHVPGERRRAAWRNEHPLVHTARDGHVRLGVRARP